MAVTPASFRSLLTEFADAGVYTDASINIWVQIGVGFVNPNRFGSSTDLAVSYFVAHHLTLGEQNRRAAAAGGTPGKLKGPTSAQTVDKVASSYDTQAISLENMGFWGLTQYGLRLFQLYRMFGAGGAQVTGGGPPAEGFGGGFLGIV